MGVVLALEIQKNRFSFFEGAQRGASNVRCSRGSSRELQGPILQVGVYVVFLVFLKIYSNLGRLKVLFRV